MKFQKITLYNSYLLSSIFFIIYLTYHIYQSVHQPLWADELYTVWSASFSTFSDFMSKSIFNDVHPPFYNILMFIWVKAFGTSELAVRFPSILANIFSIIIFYRLLNKNYDKKTTYLSLIFFTSFYFSIFIVTEARSYSILLMLVLALYYLQQKVFNSLNRLNSIKKSDAALMLVTMVALCYTHYFGLFVAIFSFVYFLFLFDIKKIAKIMLVYIIMLVCYLPWLSMTIYHSQYQKLWMEPLHLKTYFSVLDFILFSNRYLSVIPILLIFYWFFNSSISLYRSIKTKKVVEFLRENANEAYYAVLIIVPFLIFYVLTNVMTPFFTHRHYFFAMPILYLILAKSILSLKSKPLIYIVLFFMFSSFIFADITTNHLLTIYKSDYRSASKYINEKSKENDIVVVYGLGCIKQSPEIYSYYLKRKLDMLSIDGDVGKVRAIAELQRQKHNNVWLLADIYFNKKYIDKEIFKNFNVEEKQQFHKMEVLHLEAK